MADTNSYLDGLSDDDLATLESATGSEETLISGKGADADALSGLIANAPAIGKNLTIYRYYDDSKFETGAPLYSFKEPGFIVGSVTKPAVKTGAAIFGFKLPSGVKAIPLPNGTYILDRGLTVVYAPSSADVTPATVAEAFKDGKALVAGGVQLAGIQFNTGYIPTQEEIEAVGDGSLEEFYNHAHGRGGLFTSGGGSRGSGGGGGGNQGQHKAGGQSSHGQHQAGGSGQGNKGQTPQGKFVGVHHGGNRPPQVPGKGYQGKPKPKSTKAEDHLHRTANIVRAVTAIAGVVITVSAVIRAVGELSNAKQNKQDKAIQRENNRMTLNEKRSKAGLSPLRSKPNFNGDKESEGLYNHLMGLK